jgi:hypothetical protein
VRGGKAGPSLAHGLHVLAAHHPSGQKHEQVASSEVVRLESKFGLATDQICTWANYKICSSLDALQFMLRHLGH